MTLISKDRLTRVENEVLAWCNRGVVLTDNAIAVRLGLSLTKRSAVRKYTHTIMRKLANNHSGLAISEEIDPRCPEVLHLKIGKSEYVNRYGKQKIKQKSTIYEYS